MRHQCLVVTPGCKEGRANSVHEHHVLVLAGARGGQRARAQGSECTLHRSHLGAAVHGVWNGEVIVHVRNFIYKLLSVIYRDLDEPSA